MKNSCTKLTAILLGRSENTSDTILNLEFKNIPNVTVLNFPNYDCLSYLFYCLIPCSNDKPKCVQTDVTDCQYHSKITPNENPVNF